MQKTTRFQSKLARGVRFLNTPEAADYLGRHRSTLDKWRSARIVLPFYREGHAVRYCVDDLDRYLERTRVKPVAYGDGSPVGDAA